LDFWLHEFNKYRYFQKKQVIFSKETEVNNRLSMSSRRHSCLLTDNFLFQGVWKGGRGVPKARGLSRGAGAGCGVKNTEKIKIKTKETK